MRYFTISYVEQWPNGLTNIDTLAYQDDQFPTLKQCFDIVRRSTTRKPKTILGVIEYSKTDWERFTSELI